MILPTEATSVLDHGHIQLVDVMGSDADIERAARVSYIGFEGETRAPDDTRKLLRHLMRCRHTSPFEMAELKFVVKAPILTARQWVRHRTASWNEISGRYTKLPEETYTPAPERIKRQSTANKQGSGASFDTIAQIGLSEGFRDEARELKRVYNARLREGMAKEIARTNLPVSQYTEWVWKTDLHNLMHFLALRLDSHAQEEIRVYAEAMVPWIEKLFPMTWEAFVDYKLEAVTFSRMEMEIVRTSLIYNCNIEQVLKMCEEEGMTPRETREFLAKVEFPDK